MDDGGDQVEAGYEVVLALGRQVDTGRALQMLHPSRCRAIRGLNPRQTGTGKHLM